MSAICDPASYDRGIPHHLFAPLRAAPGLAWIDPSPEHGDHTGFWAVTRMADLVTVSRDTGTYSSALKHIQLYDVDEDVRDVRASMIDLDPPVHTQLRRLVSSVFTPRHVARYEHAVAERIRGLLDAVEADGGGDWVTMVAKPIPIGVICDILGVPAADHGLMVEMSDHLVAGTSGEPLDPTAYGNTTPLRELPFNSPAAFGIFDYARRARQRVLDEPGDDLLSALAVAEVDGRRLTEVEYARFFQLMIFAGNETTRSAMAHLALHLAEHRHAFDAIAPDRAGLELAAEETVRYSSPILYFRRTATTDTVLADTRVAAGDKVVMYYCSANFDETVFDEPMRFDLTRPRAPANCAYGGGGAHYCLGAPLARLELAALIDEVVGRGLQVEVAGPVEYVRSNFVNGIEHLPVRVHR
ncbi:MAG: cytochrome P450 [Actinobacteria bacterium]|uniref:Unannotated protein n=1 Tax=freshwater metagenome TaxID=449393 RepID=A0A6J6DE07_9ZZZZ|nr:cytochrome P450 [Actinomycetota bacterium]